MEIWKDIEGFEGYYQVSNLGRVKSVERYVNHPSGGLKKLKSKIMTKYISKQGYHTVTLRNLGRKVAKVHRLVCNAFLDNPLKKENVNHKNGIKTDNRVENLEWCTQLENVNHAIKTNLFDNKGEKHPFSRLKKKDIIFIRENAGKMTQKQLALKFNTVQSVISRIVRKERWKHI